MTAEELKSFVQVLCPFAPHLCEELWEQLGGKGLCSLSAWPTYDEAKCKDETVEIAVQINGKVRTRLTVATDITPADAIAAAKAESKIAAALEGMTVVKELYVPGKLVNLVIKK